MNASLDLYAIFARVAEAKSFSRAAQGLGLAKATVSKRVAELEAALGAQLLTRSTRRLALTDAGQRVLARALTIVENAEAIEAELLEERAAPRGRLRIAAPLTFTLRWLSPALPEFLAAYPEIQLELSLDDRTVDLIGEGFDAALRIGEMPDSALTARRFAAVKLMLVASPAYWAARGRPAHPGDLSLHACFRYANQSSGVYWRFTGPDGEEARVRVEGPLCVNNGDAELPALRAGLGCALLPDFIVAEDVKAGRLEAALPAWRSGDLQLHLLTPPSRVAPRRLKAFSEFLHQRFGGGRAPWL
jgi:DNA-binding transcriptional LysR family regulator